jgi:hypothetical protein
MLVMTFEHEGFLVEVCLLTRSFARCLHLHLPCLPGLLVGISGTWVDEQPKEYDFAFGQRRPSGLQTREEEY